MPTLSKTKPESVGHPAADRNDCCTVAIGAYVLADYFSCFPIMFFGESRGSDEECYSED